MKVYIYIFFSTLLMASAVNSFFVPLSLPAGGVTGVAIILNKIIYENTSLYVFIGNFLCLSLAFIYVDNKFALKSILGANILLPLFISVIPIKMYTSNVIFATVIAGVQIAAAMILLEKSGYSFGGSTILGKIWSDRKNISFIKATGFIDIFIILIGVFIFGFYATFLSVLSMVVMMVSSIVFRKIGE